MNKSDFLREMQLLDDRYKSGKPSASSMLDIYYGMLKDIPDRPYREIITGIMRSCRNYPTPDDILIMWSEWLRIHPEYRAERDAAKHTECQECDSSGFLTYIKYPNGPDIPYEYISRCAMCENMTRTTGLPELTRNQLAYAGYALTWPVKVSDPKRVIKNLSTLAGMAGRSM